LTITPDYPADAVTAALPFEVDIHGTTSGAQSGINQVAVSVDQGPETPAVDASPAHDWSIWQAHLSLTADDHRFTVTARDPGGRSASQSGSISVHRAFEQADPAIVFGTTIYVRELTDFASQFVQIPGHSGGPDRAMLAGVFHQPYDRIHNLQVFAAATSPADQRRVAVEVLRGSLTAPVPADTDQRLRGLAYEALLRQLGTSTSELRLARVAGQARRQTLAARLGIDLEGPRPDRLDLMTFSPEEITDEQLEGTFGFRAMTRTDPFEPIAALPTLQAWRQASQRSRWQAEDMSTRDVGDPPLPVIDPDHVLAANLAVPHDGDPAHDLWAARQAFINGLVSQIDQAIAQGNRTLDTFDQLMATRLGQIDLPAVADRDARGEDVSDVLGPVRLDLGAFRYLVGARAVLAAGSLLISEWTDVRDVLVQVHKLREFPTWRQKERADDIVLQPQQFVADPPAAPAGLTPAAPSAWRAGQQVHLDWQRTLQVRAVELDRLQGDLQAVVQAAETAVLPVARDEIIAVIGSRQMPPEQPQAAAERLTRQLCIDLLADSAAPTTRADQAAQTLLEALFSLRSGRLAISTSGQAWSIGQEALFDAEWEWLGSYQTWYAAITSFAYPDNHLFPGLYLPDGLNLKPTDSYTQFLADLRAARITVRRARQLAADNRDRLLLTIADPDRDGHPPETLHDTLKRLAPVTEVHTNAQLDDIRTTLAPFYGVSAGIDQLLRELFWLVPVALGLALTDAGDFAHALDWYQYAYAYQLPADRRRIFPGLAQEQSIQSTFDRPETWPVDGSNPHEVARHRAGAYTRFTVLSIARCLLAYGDNEFIRATAASNARARALYEAAFDLLRSPDVASPTGGSGPFPPNPVRAALETQAQTALGKIHQGLNIASTLPEPTDQESVQPSQYRYAVLADRAKNLSMIAQQLETAFLVAVEQADAGNYTLLQAGHDLTVAQAMLGENDLKVAAAAIGVQQANTQRDRAVIQADHYGQLLAAGPNEHERNQLEDLELARDLEAAGGIVRGIGEVASAFAEKSVSGVISGFGDIMSSAGGGFSLDAQIEQAKAGFDRRAEDWQLQQSLAIEDIELGRQQIALATIQQQIAVQERAVAGVNLAHAAATADFLATKFTSAELFEWMSGVLNQVYAYFLRQATALARLAQAQLAFERQEPNQGLIQDDYWQGPPDPAAGGAVNPTERRGLTGAERLLEDLTRLDQYAFQTDRRKLHITQTLSAAQLAAEELQRFRQTGVMTFATPQDLFDREFPGHYLRLARQAKWSILALIPPVRGLCATVSASGISRTVVFRDVFETVTLRRDPESIALTSPVNATGLFDLEPDTGLLLPFEGSGVDMVWHLEMPKAANPFDYRTIADVLLTLEYTALDSREYRQQVVRNLDRRFTGDRGFSVRDEFPDVWYALNNPDTVEDPAQRMRAVLPLTAADFPPNVEGLAVAQLALFAVRADDFTAELTVTALRHTVAGQTAEAGPVSTVGGIVGTRRSGGTPWIVLTGADPAGQWELQLEDTPALRSWFTGGQIRDLALVMTLVGTVPAWP
jgi:hypothetical protein